MLCQQELKYPLKITHTRGRVALLSCLLSKRFIIYVPANNVRILLGVRSGPAHRKRQTYKFVPQPMAGEVEQSGGQGGPHEAHEMTGRLSSFRKTNKPLQ